MDLRSGPKKLKVAGRGPGRPKGSFRKRHIPPNKTPGYPFGRRKWPPKVPFKREPSSPIVINSGEEGEGREEEEPIILDDFPWKGGAPDQGPPPPPSAGAAGLACS